LCLNFDAPAGLTTHHTLQYKYEVTSTTTSSATKYVNVIYKGGPTTAVTIAVSDTGRFSLESASDDFVDASKTDSNISLTQLEGSCGPTVGPNIMFKSEHGACGIKTIAGINIDNAWGSVPEMTFQTPKTIGGALDSRLDININAIEPQTHLKYDAKALKTASPSATLTLGKENFINFVPSSTGTVIHEFTAVSITTPSAAQ
jgi:hypothetical protein